MTLVYPYTYVTWEKRVKTRVRRARPLGADASASSTEALIHLERQTMLVPMKHPNAAMSSSFHLLSETRHYVITPQVSIETEKDYHWMTQRHPGLRSFSPRLFPAAFIFASSSSTIS